MTVYKMKDYCRVRYALAKSEHQQFSSSSGSRFQPPPRPNATSLLSYDLDMRVLTFGQYVNLDELETRLWANLITHNQYRQQFLVQYRSDTERKIRGPVMKYLRSLEKDDMKRDGLISSSKKTPKRAKANNPTSDSKGVFDSTAMDVKSAAPCPPGYTWVTRHLRKLRGKGAKLERIADKKLARDQTEQLVSPSEERAIEKARPEEAKPQKTKPEKTAAQRARKAAKLQAIKEDEERLKQLARDYARKGEEWRRKAEKQAAEIRIAEQNRPLVLPKNFKSHRQIHNRP